MTDYNTLVTGGTGMVGKNLRPLMPNATFIGSQDLDLREKDHVFDFFNDKRFDKVIHMAGIVGGIEANNSRPYEFFYDNLMINTNIVEACRRFDCHLVALSSTCVYPKFPKKYPMTIDMVHDGRPEPTNEAYAYAKRAMDLQIFFAKNLRSCVVYPTNLYGPHDHFDDQQSHVIPSLFRKILSQDNIELFGYPNTLRQFTYVKDLCYFLKEASSQYWTSKYNFGNPENIKIKTLVKIMCEITGRKPQIRYNKKLRGQKRKDVKTYSSYPYTPLGYGLECTYKWMKENNVLAVNE